MGEGRLGHAYLVSGDPNGEGMRFAEEMAVMVLGAGTTLPEAQTRHRVQARLHPDVHWVEPRGKLRQIKVEDVSAALKAIYEKSFEGGWKIVVFPGAERMNPSSGNKLLKSLEEPPANTLLLLVSSQPERLLTTLRSRCQWLTLPKSAEEEPAWMDPLKGLLANGPPRSLRARLERAAAFRDFFEIAAREEVERETVDGEENLEEDVVNARETAARRRLQRDVLSAVEGWYRDLLVCKTGGDSRLLQYADLEDIVREQAESLPMKSIRKLMENVRAAARELDGNLPVQVVLEGTVF
jgi:DNA polymerase-3 subunit delta'